MVEKNLSYRKSPAAHPSSFICFYLKAVARLHPTFEICPLPCARIEDITARCQSHFHRLSIRVSAAVMLDGAHSVSERLASCRIAINSESFARCWQLRRECRSAHCFEAVLPAPESLGRAKRDDYILSKLGGQHLTLVPKRKRGL